MNFSDIRIVKQAVEPRDGGIAPDALYEFLPQGLRFSAPLTLSITRDRADVLPVLIHISEGKMNFISGAEVKINSQNGSQTISAQIKSFSYYGTVNGFFYVQLLAGADRRMVGASFDMPFSVSSIPQPQRYSFAIGGGLAPSVTQSVSSPRITGVWSAPGPYFPNEATNVPAAIQSKDGIFSHSQRFQCMKPGDGIITLNAKISYELSTYTSGPSESLREDFAYGSVLVDTAGSCVLPEAKVLWVTTQCEGVFSITGSVDELGRDSVEAVKISITGPAGSADSEATYNSRTGAFSLSKELFPADYEYSVGIRMRGASTDEFPGITGKFKVTPCPGGGALMLEQQGNANDDDRKPKSGSIKVCGLPGEPACPPR